VEIYNVGSEDQVNVKEIADIVCQEMGLRNVEYVYTGGVDGGRGWKGDVKVMLLNIEKIKSLGWKPKLNSCQAVERTVKALLRERKSIFMRA
jgi:UDP-glucose 4-epimerase